MPFADDLRKFTFRSLDRLVSTKGEVITKHAHLPTNEQMKAMDNFVDAMDLMRAGEKDDNGQVVSRAILYAIYSISFTQYSPPMV